MNDPFWKWHLPILPDTPNATFSPGSEAGPTLRASPDGLMTVSCGQDPHHASHSATQAPAAALPTTATCGLSSADLSQPDVLLSSWVSRLQQRLDVTGLTTLQMTWQVKATPAGRQFCRLALSARGTDVNGFGLLPTPSGTSNHGKNHVAGRLDEWGGSSNPWRGTPDGRQHSPGFELWMMGFPDLWRQLMPPAMPSSRRSRLK